MTKFKNARLCVARLSGDVYIAEQDNRLANYMSDNQRKVPRSEFISVVYDYLSVNYPDTECVISQKGKPVAMMKLLSDQPFNSTNDRLLDEIVIWTRTGLKINLLNPAPESISIEDIASGLAYSSHFAGQTPNFFSIAQHCVMVHDEFVSNNPSAPNEMKLLALMHDASEAYIGDMIKPIKVSLPEFSRIENILMEAICKRYGMPYEFMSRIKPYDIYIQEIEANFFYREGREIVYKSPEDSRDEFLRRFNNLWKNGIV